MRKFYTKFPGAKLTEPLWGAVAGVQEGQVLISRVSRHGHQASGIWVAFFPRCQRYRLRTGAAHGARAAPPNHGGD